METFNTIEEKINYLEQKVNFLQLLLALTHTKIKVLRYIILNSDSNHKLCKTIPQVARATNVSYQLAFQTFKALEEIGTIKKIDTAWVITPSFITNFKDKAQAIIVTTLFKECKI